MARSRFDLPFATTTMLGLPPLPASDAVRCQLIDVRPTHERYGGLGFVAGSLSMSQFGVCSDHVAAIERMAGRRLPVLMCLAGHRSKALVDSLAGVAKFPLSYLEGGLLAWNEAGLPITGRSLPRRHALVLTPAEFRQQLRERLDEVLADMPYRAGMTADRCLERCPSTWRRPIERMRPSELRIVLEQLAAALLDLAIPRWRISTLLDLLLAGLPAPGVDPQTEPEPTAGRVVALRR